MSHAEVTIHDLLIDWKVRRGNLNREIDFLKRHCEPRDGKHLLELQKMALELDRLISRYGFDA